VISIDEVIGIHAILIENFGGTTGLRNRELLESALARPVQTFDGKELYPSPEDKAAALTESIIINHPFLDGNKRVGYVLMRITLREFNLDIDASEDEKYTLIIEVSKGTLNFEQLRDWIKSRLTKIRPVKPF
jgi:death-on-curing protein